MKETNKIYTKMKTKETEAAHNKHSDAYLLNPHIICVAFIKPQSGKVVTRKDLKKFGEICMIGQYFGHRKYFKNEETAREYMRNIAGKLSKKYEVTFVREIQISRNIGATKKQLENKMYI